MGSIKVGEPFGLDSKAVNSLSWEIALKRIIHDQRSDFIYAPHMGYIYRRAGTELISQIKNELSSGKYSPGLPITIEVPKPFRIRVSTGKRMGPLSSRPGSILLPHDRLLYQALADVAAPIVDAKTDKSRSFSHRLAGENEAAMFLPTRSSWNQLQKALKNNAKEKDLKYILKLDIANFFGALNLHTLVNLLADDGYPSIYGTRLEVILTSFTGTRSSRGLLQGMYPSDLFGNYYLRPIDEFLEETNLLSARYVDDIYIFVPSLDSAETLMRKLIPELRAYDLSIHEGKSVVMPKAQLVTEEPDLEELFGAAVDEISAQVEEEDFDVDYGFQSEWEDAENQDEEEEASDLELEATKKLFDYITQYSGNEENIERFCLPLFAKAESSYAISHVKESFLKRPSMSQIYSSYLATFIDDDESSANFLASLLDEEMLPDWSKMWVIAALLQADSPISGAVTSALQIAKDPSKHDALRAVAAVYVGNFGNLAKRKAMISLYSSVSPYVQAAVYFSSRVWPTVERGNAKAMWGNLTPLNSLLTKAMK